MPSARDFVTGSCQATIFTAEASFSGARFLTSLFPDWGKLFDAEPTSIPLPEGVPNELPRLILQSKNQHWRCEIAPARLNIFWRRTASSKTTIELTQFFDGVMPKLLQYRAFVGCPVNRVAAVVQRFVPHENPGEFLARHFCKDEWVVAPFNRPENFELHAHKQFSLLKGTTVHSWVRNKTGKLADTNQPIVLVEQDLNTPVEDPHDYDDAGITEFFRAAVRELDVILDLYYPVRR